MTNQLLDASITFESQRSSELSATNESFERERADKWVTAYETGRLLNRMRYFSSQAWLIGRWDIIEDNESFHRLPAVVARLSADPEVSDTLRAAVHKALEDLRGNFQSEPHANDLASALRDLTSDRFTGSAVSDEERITQFVQEMGIVPKLILDSLCIRIDQTLELEQKWGLRLGELVDQGAFPQTVAEELVRNALWREAEQDPVNVTTVGWESRSPRSDDGTSRSGRIVLGPEPMPSTDQPPNLSWYAELRSLWQRLGFCADEFENRLQQLELMGRFDGRELATVVETLHQRAREAVMNRNRNEAGAHSVDPEPSQLSQVERIEYFELTIEPASRTVTNASGRKISFDKKEVPFNLFCQLARAGERYTSKKELYGRWESFGGARGSDYNGIRSAITRVIKLITPLGFQIENQRNIGWRLKPIKG